jgi:hypothetical protein
MDIRVIDKNMANLENSNSNEIKYFDLNNEFLRGRAFNTGFHRLRETDIVSKNVEVLQKHPSGLNISFKTNANRIKIRVKMATKAYMNHMTAVAQIGFDLYYKHNDKYVFLATTKVNAIEFDITLVEGLDDSEKEFRIYFPLYAECISAYVGINENAEIEFIKEKQEKVIIYGTSISQGGCASRPGMSYSNILDRITNYEYINLGFSGSAHLELEMADIINEIDKKCIILEVEANNSRESLMNKLPQFIERLKCDKIYLISHFPETITLLKPGYQKVFNENSEFQKSLSRIEFIDGNELLKELEYDGTVDGVHLTDLGFHFIAHKLKEIIK